MNSIIKPNLFSSLCKLSNTGTMTEVEQERVVGNVINYEKTGLDVACGLDTWQMTTNGVQVCMDNSQSPSNSATNNKSSKKTRKSGIVQTKCDCYILKSATTSYKEDNRTAMMDKCIDACEAPCRHIVNGHLPCRGFTLGSVEFRSSKYDSCRTMLFGGRRVAICKTCKNTL